MSAVKIEIEIPDWLADCAPPGSTFASSQERMQLVIELASQNVARRSGGPFGAAVFECESGRLLAAGVNLVEASARSIAHAEIVAITLAQRELGVWNLSGPPAYELVTSCEPCAMCFGALPWSGVGRLVCGARADDAEALGFDEGPKPADWVEQLVRRGISVERDVDREAARAVLHSYRERGGLIYSPAS